MNSPSRSSGHFDGPPDWETLARYRAGESPAAEAQAVSAWLASHPAETRMLDELDASLASALGAKRLPVVDTESALRTVRARIGADAGSGRLPVVRGARAVAAPAARRRRTLAMVAAAAGIAAVAFGLAQRDGRGIAPAARGGPGTMVVTEVGVRDSVRLPDGTRVVLGPGSRLSVAASFGTGSREVQLDGVARFTVVHDEARPFTVRAGDAVVRDIGTAFTVRTRAAEPRHVTVAVTEGVVAMRAAGAADTGVVLRAGDRAMMQPGGAITTERGVATAEDAAWTTGKLVYVNAPLHVVGDDLRRWHGLELRIPDTALAAMRVTASFDGEPVDRILSILGLALGADVERSGDTAVLRPTTRN